MRSRALRRHYYYWLKERVRHYWVCSALDWHNGDHTPVEDSVLAFRANTPKACSCWMCGNPRKYFKEKTKQERSCLQYQ